MHTILVVNFYYKILCLLLLTSKYFFVVAVKAHYSLQRETELKNQRASTGFHISSSSSSSCPHGGYVHVFLCLFNWTLVITYQTYQTEILISVDGSKVQLGRKVYSIEI